jgi:hypothetical protein
VHTLIGAMLAVQMAVMQVVNVVAVQHRFVSTPRAVGVTVVLSLSVLHRGQDASLPGRPSDPKIKPGTGEWDHRLGIVVLRSRGRGKVTTGR